MVGKIPIFHFVKSSHITNIWKTVFPIVISINVNQNKHYQYLCHVTLRPHGKKTEKMTKFVLTIEILGTSDFHRVCGKHCSDWVVKHKKKFGIKQVVLETRVSPENTSKYVDTVTVFAKSWTKGHWPLHDLWPQICWGLMCGSTQGSLCQSPMKIHKSMWIQWPFLQKTWTKDQWPLHDLWPQICWGHMCDSTQGSLCPSPMTIHQSMWIQWPFLQTLEPKVIDP